MLAISIDASYIVVSRSQTSFLALDIIACISARIKKALVWFTVLACSSHPHWFRGVIMTKSITYCVISCFKGTRYYGTCAVCTVI